MEGLGCPILLHGAPVATVASKLWLVALMGERARAFALQDVELELVLSKVQPASSLRLFHWVPIPCEAAKVLWHQQKGILAQTVSPYDRRGLAMCSFSLPFRLVDIERRAEGFRAGHVRR